MLGIFIIYWIGRKFYDLAAIHNRSPWGWAILGVVVYYGTQLLFGMLAYLASPSTFDNMDKGSELMFNLVGVAVGALVWYVFLQYITKKWENESEQTYENINDKIDNIGRDLQN